ncbi:DUF3726 domain-containing protein [Gymnodinialimonas sp. 2305UL16-5]|uniref:DUF3726 domain-containing protein n=1 Tax=Gymnodinialimonas mytili TaxID=3126503 RepID=UPI0030B1DF25
MSLDWSLGEVEALSAKAARGAGRAYGVAQEAGYATAWLCARGYDGAGAMAALLRATEGVAHTDLGPEVAGPLCPLVLGCFLSDGGAWRDWARPIHVPLILAPFVIPAQSAIILQAGQAGLKLSAQGALIGADPGSDPVEVQISSCAPFDPQPLRSRAGVTPAARDALMALAERTYAPATAASRAKGAGDGGSAPHADVSPRTD